LLPETFFVARKCALIFHGRDRMGTQVISEEIRTSVTITKVSNF
jgi:hypothetical protein